MLLLWILQLQRGKECNIVQLCNFFGRIRRETCCGPCDVVIATVLETGCLNNVSSLLDQRLSDVFFMFWLHAISANQGLDRNLSRFRLTIQKHDCCEGQHCQSSYVIYDISNVYMEINNVYTTIPYVTLDYISFQRRFLSNCPRHTTVLVCVQDCEISTIDIACGLSPACDKEAEWVQRRWKEACAWKATEEMHQSLNRT